jgi:hypothetical protein
MSDQVRKITINLRSAVKKHSEAAPVHHEVKAHQHPPQHEEERVLPVKKADKPHVRVLTARHAEEKSIPLEVAEAHPTAASPAIPETQHAEALVPSKMVVPKKPTQLEGVSLGALSVGYFCMEMGLESDVPTYAGGLGILAGDMMKSCADLDVPVVGVTLLYRKGYFKQRFDHSGWQFEEDEFWAPREHLIPLAKEVVVELEGRRVHVRAWMYKLSGARGRVNPILFLDTDIEGNSDDDRHLTDRLYTGDSRYRLLQEAILGIAGVRMLIALGATNIQKFHMNEGHSALLTPASAPVGVPVARFGHITPSLSGWKAYRSARPILYQPDKLGVMWPNLANGTPTGADAGVASHV